MHTALLHYLTLKAFISAWWSDLHQCAKLTLKSKNSYLHSPRLFPICRVWLQWIFAWALRPSNVCWWSPLTSLTKGNFTLCHLPPAKEISVITCSFLNIIKHQPFHHTECVTFRFIASLSVTDRSFEGQCCSIFISLLLMGPKNSVLCWPPVLSGLSPPPSTHTPFDVTSSKLLLYF